MTSLSMSATTIFVGNPLVRTSLKNAIKEISLDFVFKVIRDPCVNFRTLNFFGRDIRVVLLSGSHLIPFCSSNEELDLKLKPILPKSSDEFIYSLKKGYGIGIDRFHHEQALTVASSLRIPFKCAQSCVEGGNCFLFRGRDGLARAIVGIHSVYLTILSLEEQRYFNEPLTLEQKSLEAKMVIAQELEVSLENIAFIFQRSFHIDLELCELDGDIILHSENESMNLLKEYKMTTHPYYKKVVRRFLEDTDITELNRIEIERIGCKVTLVAGKFEGEDCPVINFFNGIYINKHFITNSAPGEYDFLQERFKQVVSRAFTQISISFLPLNKDRPMSYMLTHHEAGLRCYTWFL